MPSDKFPLSVASWKWSLANPLLIRINGSLSAVCVSISDTLHHRVALIGHSGRPGNTLIVSHTSAIYTNSLTQLSVHLLWALLWERRQERKKQAKKKKERKKIVLLIWANQTKPVFSVAQEMCYFIQSLRNTTLIVYPSASTFLWKCLLLPGVSKSKRASGNWPPPPPELSSL